MLNTNIPFKTALAWSFGPKEQHLSLYVPGLSHNFTGQIIVQPPTYHFTMSSPPPAIITQEEDDALTMAQVPVPPKKSTTHSPSLFQKKVVQYDLHSKPVPASKLQVKVKSYQKRNGTSVKKYSRKTSQKTFLKFANPKINFKKLHSAQDSCAKSINLAHSIYIEELCSTIYSVGKTDSNLSSTK